MQPAVATEFGTGGEPGVLAGQPDHDGGDLFGCTQTLDRNGRHDLVEHVLPDGLDHIGQDVARRHRVDRHPFGGHFQRQRHGETMHARFGRGVIGLAELAFFAIHRRDVDDAAPAPLDHAVDHLLGHIEHGVEIGSQHQIPIFVAHFAQYGVAGDAGVVHQNVHLSVLGEYFLKGRLSRVPVGHIALGGIDIEALRAHGFQPTLLAAGIGAAACDDLVPCLAQPFADAGADTAHTTRDISHFFAHFVLLVLVSV